MKHLKFIFLSSTACFLNSCSSPNNGSVIQSPVVMSAPEGNLVSLESRIAAQVELHRKAAGLRPMVHHPGLAKLAREHSSNLIGKFTKDGKRVLNHDGFSARSNTMLSTFSMSKAAENVAYVWGGDSDTAVSISRNWMNSPGHKKNILTKWNYTGVGAAVAPDGTVYATQLFGN